MADPLSVVASIIGIIAAAGKVAETLGPFISTVKDATKSATTIHTEVNNCKIILSALQVLLEDLGSAPRKRRGLIQVSQLVTTLTDGALIFSELEPLVLQLGTSTEKWSTRIQWARKKDALEVLSTRLQLFKSSINVMLNILQCESDLEAARSRAELHVLTSNVVASNLNISNRLSFLGRSSQRQVDSASITDQSSHRSSTATIQSQIRYFGFEPDLQGSWVYRKARRSTSDVSYRSSVGFSHAWTALSDISLSDVSVITVVALPISSNDLLNGHHYQTGNSQLVSSTQHMITPRLRQTKIEAPNLAKLLVSGFLRRADTASPTASSREQNARGIVKQLEIGSPTLINASVFGWQSPEDVQIISSSTEKDVQLGKNKLKMGSPAIVDIAVPDILSPAKSDPGLGELQPRSPPSTVDSNETTSCKKQYKIVMLGHEDVDKSKLALKFLQPDDALWPLTEGSYRRHCTIDGSMAVVEVLGAVAQEEFLAMQEQNIRDGHGFMLLYSITSRSSFLAIRSFRQLMDRHRDPSAYPYFPTILVGVHCEREDARDVTAAEGYTMARELNCQFLEVLHQTEQNAEKAYFDLVREIRFYDQRYCCGS